MVDRFLGPKQLATILGVSPRTLRNWRRDGRGPRWVVYSYGVIRYAESDIDAWVETLDHGDGPRAEPTQRGGDPR